MSVQHVSLHFKNQQDKHRQIPEKRSILSLFEKKKLQQLVAQFVRESLKL